MSIKLSYSSAAHNYANSDLHDLDPGPPAHSHHQCLLHNFHHGLYGMGKDHYQHKVHVKYTNTA